MEKHQSVGVSPRLAVSALAQTGCWYVLADYLMRIKDGFEGEDMHAPAITFEVANRFHGLRRRYLIARLIACVCFGSAAFLFGWMVLALCDYLWELPLLARRSLMIAVSVVVVGVTLWESIRTASDSQSGRFVGRLERQFDLLGQRLRTLLETVEGRWSAPEAMVSALSHQTMGRWETVQPTQVIPRRLVVTALFCASLMASVALVGYFTSRDDWQTAMLRALGIKIPYTRLVVSPGDARLLEGAQLSVQLELQGRTDHECTLRYRNSDSPEWTETTLEPSRDRTERSAMFIANLGKISQSIEYQFLTSVGETRAYTIRMQPLIEVEDFAIQVTPPDYTHLASRTFSTAELSVLQGSQVSVTLRTNHPLNQVQLQIGQSDKTLAVIDVEQGPDPRIWTFALPTRQSIRWHFTGSGEDGTPIKPHRGRLNVRHDQPPKLEWQEPQEDLTVHMLAEVPMQVQVSDDYGVSEAGIVFQLSDEEFVLKQWPAESDDPASATADAITTQLRLAEVLPLESFSLSEKDFVAYYAFAKDNRVGSTQHVESEIRYIYIRPLKQFYSELDLIQGRGNGSAPPGLDEIIRRQRFLINRTRTLVRSPSSSGPDHVGVIERMVDTQSELADLTRYLVEFLISQGTDDTESLSQAEAAMLQAADSMSTASFDAALVQEQDALRFLAEARRTLEIVLSRNNNAQRQQALNRFRRQMQQRLRRTVQTDTKLADTLQQIAEEQMRLANNAERISKARAAVPSQPDSSSPSVDRPAPGTAAVADAPAAGDVQAQADMAEDKVNLDEQLHAHQQELLDRLMEIDSGLSADVKRSELATDRLQQATSAMDELVTEASQSNWYDVSAHGRDLAAQLHELASHIGALAQGEPSQRIAAARDLTTSLANMEGALANAEFSVVSAIEQGTQPPAEIDAAALDKLRAEGEDMSRRVQARADTLTDVLAQPVNAVDLAGNEVYEQLLRLAEERQFVDKLAASRAAVSEPPTQRETAAWADAAMNRATEYADVAADLESLYRQLVAPRLDNLRQLESKANALARLLDAQLKTNGSGGDMQDKKSEKSSSGKSAKMLEQELEQGLIAAGLEELADQLRQGDDELDEENKPMTLSELDDGVTDGRRSQLLFSVSQLRAMHGRVIRIDRQLQEILRDLILNEISTDKNTPVPPQYQELVDRYFRSLSGSAAATEVSK